MSDDDFHGIEWSIGKGLRTEIELPTVQTAVCDRPPRGGRIQSDNYRTVHPQDLIQFGCNVLAKQSQWVREPFGHSVQRDVVIARNHYPWDWRQPIQEGPRFDELLTPGALRQIAADHDCVRRKRRYDLYERLPDSRNVGGTKMQIGDVQDR